MHLVRYSSLQVILRSLPGRVRIGSSSSPFAVAAMCSESSSLPSSGPLPEPCMVAIPKTDESTPCQGGMAVMLVTRPVPLQPSGPRPSRAFPVGYLAAAALKEGVRGQDNASPDHRAYTRQRGL